MTEIDKNVLEILRLFEAQVLDSTLKTFKEIIDGDLTTEELEERVKNDITIEIPTVIDATQELLESNYERDDLLRQSHIVGQQYELLKDELKYYKELFNETNK